jgi:hypothetical protein
MSRLSGFTRKVQRQLEGGGILKPPLSTPIVCLYRLSWKNFINAFALFSIHPLMNLFDDTNVGAAAGGCKPKIRRIEVSTNRKNSL